MKRALCALAAVIIIFALTSCGVLTGISGDALTDYRISSNITSGAARVAAADGRIFVSSGSGGIYVIDPEKDYPAGYDIESNVFKAGEYGDICFFGGMIYALRSGPGDLDEIVAIDPSTGAEKKIREFSGADRGNVWFSDLIGDVLYVWVNGSIYSLDASGTFRDTGLRDTLMITGKGSYVRAYEKDGFSIDNNIYAAGFQSGKPNINITATPCNPGFVGGAPLYRVIAEDLSASEAGDFDFNDVVFDVVKAEGGKTTLKLICAGGTLPLRVKGIEVHGLFGETTPNASGTYKMYNTGAGPTVDPVTFEVDGEFTTPEQINNIEIEVLKNGSWMELKATRGEAACKILVDDTFTPVPERTNIANAYMKFTDYVQGTFQDDFWWK